MVIDLKSAYKAIKIVLKNKEGKKTFMTSLNCGLFTSGSALAAAAVLGPVGIFGGALVSSTVAYFGTRGELKSLLYVVKEDFTEEERKKLIEHVVTFCEQLEIKDVMILFRIAQGQLSPIDLFALIKILVDIILEERGESKNVEELHDKLRCCIDKIQEEWREFQNKEQVSKECLYG